ncbi:unnamed protein product [Cuscuta epithymum]|uniref:Uncharacterized protein n=1 Tax=Cuscuta epithymum TaxID=186058 RepID=A0AAV0BYG3_9ASTE|nr:unnamed protein product [Cuscuta epithymum]
MDSSLVPLVSIGKVSMDYGFIRAIIIGIKKMPVEIVVVGLQGMFQDEWLMIRPPLEPPPRMMYETWIRLLCQFILLTFVLIHGAGDAQRMTIMIDLVDIRTKPL